MATTPDFCILIPAETPLFVHVYHAIGEFLSSSLKKNLAVLPYSLHSPANDFELATFIAQGDKFAGMSVLGGICDPRQAGLNNLKIHAAIVKRLGFYLVSSCSSRESVLDNHSDFETIYGHGGKIVRNGNKNNLTSTAQALAECFKRYLHLPTAIIKNRGIDNLRLGERDLAITCNIPLALGLQRLNLVHVWPIAKFFPEWSRLFVSGLARRANLASNELDAYEELIFAIQMACRDLRFNKTTRELKAILRSHFPDQINNKLLINHARFYGSNEKDAARVDLARITADELINARIIPSNIENTTLGAHLTDSLWDDQTLVNSSLYRAKERIDMFKNQSQRLHRSPATVNLDSDLSSRARIDEIRRPLKSLIDGSRTKNSPFILPVDIAIITALDSEMAAVKLHFTSHMQIPFEHDQVRPFTLAKIIVQRGSNEKRTRRVLLACVGLPGRIQSAILTINFLLRWKPPVVILAGIAAGIIHKDLKEPQLGDMILPQRVVDYEGQKLFDTETDYRFKEYSVDTRLFQLAKRISETDWHRGIKVKRPKKPTWIDRKRPSILAIEKEQGCILCGDKVVASDEYLKRLFSKQPCALGLEMESAGVAAAVETFGGGPVRFIVLKSISDFASNKKGDAECEAWRPYVEASSAAFVAEMCRHPSLL